MTARTNVLSTTVVLVHGALTDASVWTDVAADLLKAGHRVVAPALPMRSLDDDVSYLNAVLGRIDGPIVLVGHSYAGSVISHPKAIASANVDALVFVAAFQPDHGEASGELNERFPGTGLTPDNLEVTPNPLGGDDLVLRPDRFSAVYAADVEPARAGVMAVSQRPINPAALGETFDGTPTWRSIPSWSIVSTEDRSLPPAVLRFMAQRAGSTITEVDSSHAVPVSQARAVTEVITAAVNSIS